MPDQGLGQLRSGRVLAKLKLTKREQLPNIAIAKSSLDLSIEISIRKLVVPISVVLSLHPTTFYPC